MVSVLAAYVSVSVLVSDFPDSSVWSRELASVSRPASRPNLDGLGHVSATHVSVLVSEVPASTTTLVVILSTFGRAYLFFYISKIPGQADPLLYHTLVVTRGPGE